ncbi:SDR family NAD(P)-dependent oxidoreductase [Deinococcus ruber]|uniref:Probable oxidoreductase n=1 Tax=Deinococcus ruber TaxID=1848197 RepID=A0A918CF87_9DEIO|nr:SDR family NAD(P)-dependent oxidoreductase [Deinococcus ruber]GGR19298.1 oxidoreductase [Deinococcus ruber]
MSLITTPFDRHSTAADVITDIDLTHRRAIVTGASSGISVETARALVSAGADVTLAVRSLEAGVRVANDLIATTGNARVRVAHLDLSEPASVAAFVSAWTGPLHLLINNAGIMATPEQHTPQGWELQFATNHLGHFALATGLHRALVAASGARIVSLSSAGHTRSPVVFGDIHFHHRPYDPFLAYGQSKTANVLFAVEASRRWAEQGITANAVMPGAVRTEGVANLNLTATQIAHAQATRSSGPETFWKTPAQGAATSILVATSPLLSGVGGRYFEDSQEAGPHVPGTMRGVAGYALDPAQAERLWEVSETLLARATSPSD